ncbi:MAG: phosphatase PAP2 family protein [Oscillospiraceae bacterium]|nr:phosphatase PAP2 family protein [Oscillospiraceae bacterium]
MFSIPVIPGAAEWINAVFAEFDMNITLFIHQLYELGGNLMTTIMEIISLLGKSGIFLIILSLILAFFKKTRRFGTAMCIGLFLGAVFVNLYLKIAIARPRPYTIDFYKQLWMLVGQNVESDFCFPSGHTNAAFAAMVPVFILGNKKASWLALVFGVLMGISRVYLVVHYPSDVVAGMITGTIAGLLGTIFSMLAPRFWYRWDLLKKRRDEDFDEEDDEACSDSVV